MIANPVRRSVPLPQWAATSTPLSGFPAPSRTVPKTTKAGSARWVWTPSGAAGSPAWTATSASHQNTHPQRSPTRVLLHGPQNHQGLLHRVVISNHYPLRHPRSQSISDYFHQTVTALPGVTAQGSSCQGIAGASRRSAVLLLHGLQRRSIEPPLLRDTAGWESCAAGGSTGSSYGVLMTVCK